MVVDDVPAYLVPYGVMTLVWGPLSDRIGRRPVILGSLTLFVVLTAATMVASSGTAFVWWRVATGIGASGVVPISLALIGDLVAFERRGRALGWLFGAMAGGIAVGSTGGALGLAAPVPLVVAAVLVTVLSLGYDLTQPLLGGIVTALPANRGQAMGFNVFTLFVGFGLGGLIFQATLGWGFTGALAAFGTAALIAAALAVRLFRAERMEPPVAAKATSRGSRSR